MVMVRQTKARDDHDRLAAYVANFFVKHERTKFPTVRYAARALTWTQREVEDAVEGDPKMRMQLTFGAGSDEVLGDRIVELYEAPQ